MTTEFSGTNKKIIEALSRLLYRKTNSLHLAAVIGSWGDTLEDEEILQLLEENEEKDWPNTEIVIN